MTPSQVRAELLGEHFELRQLIENARAILRKEPQPTDLRAVVDQLADALLEHSQHEEAALRVIVMDEHHVAEHAKLVAVLHTAVGDADAFVVQARVGAVLDELESHMAHEEEVLLGEDLLPQ